MKDKKQFYSLNDEDVSPRPKSKGKQRMRGKQNEPCDDVDDNTLVGTSTSANRNSPLRQVGSEDSILQLKAHAEEVVSHHAQRLSETTLSNTSSTTSSGENIHQANHGIVDNRIDSDYSTTDEEDAALPLPVTARPKTSILGNLLDLYAQKLVGPAQSTPPSVQSKSPPIAPAIPEAARIPLSPLNRQNNQSGDTQRGSLTSPTSIPPARSRSNSLPDNNVTYPPKLSLAWQKRRRSQGLRINYSNMFTGARGPLTPVDEDTPHKSRSRSSSVDSNTSFTSVNQMLKSFPNHSNFHRVIDFDDNNENTEELIALDQFAFKKGLSPRPSVESRRDSITNPLLNEEPSETLNGDELPKTTNNFEVDCIHNISYSLERHDFLLRLGRALMTYGAPTHRIESQLIATANYLDIMKHIHLYNVNWFNAVPGENFYIRSSGGLDLSRLSKTHKVYMNVVSGKMDAMEGSLRLREIVKSPDQYNAWQMVLIGASASAAVAPMAFSASLLDIPIVFILGAMLTFVKVSGVVKRESFGFILEISCACLIAMAARALYKTNYFCFQSVAASAIVLILPGWIIACGALELASRNIVSGSIRVVYALCYSMFLGFAISIGSDFISVLGPEADGDQNDQLDTVTLSGTFLPNSSLGDISNPMHEGSFTFTNTSAPAHKGNVVCIRHPDNPFYLKAMPKIYLLICAPAFATLLSMYNRADWRSKEMWIGVLISCSGYASNVATTMFTPDRSDIISSVSSFTVGFLGNAYSKMFKKSAFPVTVTGILLSVPSGISAAGGIAMSNPSPDNETSFSRGLVIGLRMFQTAVGIVVGLFLSTIFVYNIGARRGFLFSF
ncbi:DUF1212-domain-containing protein [Wallemia mellicola]|nr:hypothetical protein E3Q24_02580 [Wallemia mellicola]TIB85399.1 DUF1212-domain-containing protein [Wallemia mellicola]TIB88602.1 DUF1212-domain-containing protein [Wallemia mellicola]TIC35685.1 DUF1212-domain-containing protein [Wallemia mellicola]TIC40803.1 DUF1212-domain-containing protein [Wallemia mellicola]